MLNRLPLLLALVFLLGLVACTPTRRGSRGSNGGGGDDDDVSTDDDDTSDDDDAPGDAWIGSSSGSASLEEGFWSCEGDVDLSLDGELFGGGVVTCTGDGMDCTLEIPATSWLGEVEVEVDTVCFFGDTELNLVDTPTWVWGQGVDIGGYMEADLGSGLVSVGWEGYPAP